jgi:hypothetical protein
MNHTVTFEDNTAKSAATSYWVRTPSDWPYMDAEGVTQIRCLLPGAGT